MAPITIRRHFPDMDNLLAEILRRHLRAIASALGKIPFDAPDRGQARRAAYLAATRTPLGAPTEAHLLLIRDRNLLPEDEFEPIEDLRLSIGNIVAGPHAQLALALLDMPELGAAEVETALAALTAPVQPARQPRPPFARPRLVHTRPPQPRPGAMAEPQIHATAPPPPGRPAPPPARAAP